LFETQNSGGPIDIVVMDNTQGEQYEWFPESEGKYMLSTVEQKKIHLGGYSYVEAFFSLAHRAVTALRTD
jgi:hypothetical protein